MLGIIFASHGSFIALSYSVNLLSGFANFVDPVVVLRILMLFQFLPLLLVMYSKTLSRSRSLLFLTFAICISTLYVVGDFGLGFYGAAVDYQTGLFPRMRGPTTLMAYRDSGRLVFIDYHAQYFLEFVCVHFLSEITGLNYIFTYVFIIRALAITIWSFLFVWSSTLVRERGHRAWMLLLASSIILANQGYNDEMSFGPVLLLFFYLVAVKQQSRSFTLLAILAVSGTLFASFRETLLLGIISVMTLCITMWNKIRSKGVQPEFSAARTPVSVMVLILVFARTFLLTSQEYVGEYASRVFLIIDHLWAMLNGSWTLKQPLLVTFERIHNPIDTYIALLSAVFAVSLLIFIAILACSLILKRRFDPFSSAIFIAFIVALSIPVGAYLTQKFTGYAAIYDYMTATYFPRSLAPLVVLAMMSHSPKIKRRYFRAKKTLLMLVTVYLSLTMIFAPFIFSRKEVKSSYDMLRVFGDTSEYVILGNSEYEFVLSSLPNQSRIVILSPPAGFIQHFLGLPLSYKTGKQISSAQTGATAPFLANRIFDNSLFTTWAYGDSILLDELPLFD